MDDLKAVVLKLAAADNLRSQGYVRSEQSLPKNNKRGEPSKKLYDKYMKLCKSPVSQ